MIKTIIPSNEFDAPIYTRIKITIDKVEVVDKYEGKENSLYKI